MKKNKSVDILLPCYNEDKTIREQIKRIKKIIKSKKYNYNIVVCDNNSSDNSRKFARNEKVKVLYRKRSVLNRTADRTNSLTERESFCLLPHEPSASVPNVPLALNKKYI